jgi:acetyl esterase/lipase
MLHGARARRSLAATILVVVGVAWSAAPVTADTTAPSTPLSEARAGFTTHLTYDANAHRPAPTPPAGVLDLVRYPSAVGDLVAYVTPDPADGQRHPAIIWIVGGDNNTIEDVWSHQPASNDQTATPLRKAGIVTMYPSQRGGNMNPGRKEGFLGECDDVLAAARYLAALPYVDPNRIYLGGHSNGGTLALLVAELPNPFRAVFSLGPAATPNLFNDPRVTPFDTDDKQELLVRAPGAWLESVQTPTWVAEGARKFSNLASLRLMKRVPHNDRVHFTVLEGYDHFTEVRPTIARIAREILADDGQGEFSTSLW